MSYIARNHTGITVIWADGYLPSRKDLAKIIKTYANKKPKFNLSQIEYKPEESWPREKLFESAASMIIPDFHDHDEFKIYRPTCSVWLAKLNDADNPSLKNIVTETKNSKRERDYYHIISVHSSGARECTTHLLDNLRFEIRPDDEYQNLEAFQEECEHIIYQILEVFIEPYFVAGGVLDKWGLNVLRYTR